MVSISRIKDLGKKIPLSAAVTEIIGEDSQGQRIDNFLIKRLKNVPKSHIYQLLRSGQVRLNSKRIGPEYHLQSGDAVRIPPVRMVESSVSLRKKLPTSGFIRFNVLFEDEALVVVNKPPGVAVHGGSGVSFGSLNNCVPNIRNGSFWSSSIALTGKPPVSCCWRRVALRWLSCTGSYGREQW